MEYEKCRLPDAKTPFEAALVERIEILERSLADVSLKNEELEGVARKLQNHLHLLQRGLTLLLRGADKKDTMPPAKAAIQDL